MSVTAATQPLARALAGLPLWKTAAVLALARRRPQRAAMTELLSIGASSRRTRAERVNALSIAVSIAIPRDGRAFARLLAHHDRLVQAMAIDGIERVRYRPALPAVAAIVNTPGHPVRIRAALAMTVLGRSRGVNSLVGYLHDRDPRIREAGCHAIYLLYEGRRIAPALEACTRDRDARVVVAAKRAIRTIAARTT